MKQLIPRKFERKRCVGEAMVRALPAGPSQAAQVLDLGCSGLALFVGQGMVKGQTIEITFRVNGAVAAQGLGKRTGQVVRSRANPDGNVVGVVFGEPFAEQELRLVEQNWIRS